MCRVGVTAQNSPLILHFRVVSMERTQDGALRRRRVVRMVERVNQHADTQRIRKQDFLVSQAVADLPDLREELDARCPFVRGEPRLAAELMEVSDDTLEEVVQTRVTALRVDNVHVLRDVLLSGPSSVTSPPSRVRGNSSSLGGLR